MFSYLPVSIQYKPETKPRVCITVENSLNTSSYVIMLSHYPILGVDWGGMRENNAYCFLLCHAIVTDNVVASLCTDHQSPSQA